MKNEYFRMSYVPYVLFFFIAFGFSLSDKIYKVFDFASITAPEYIKAGKHLPATIKVWTLS